MSGMGFMQKIMAVSSAEMKAELKGEFSV